MLAVEILRAPPAVIVAKGTRARSATFALGTIIKIPRPAYSRNAMASRSFQRLYAHKCLVRLLRGIGRAVWVSPEKVW